MQIDFLGAHNTESKETRQVTLLVDGVLALDAGALTSTLSPAEQRKLKAVMLTHHHYDHVRDIPALAMNAALNQSKINLYATQTVYDNLTAYLLNGELYPTFFSKPEGNPAIHFSLIEPYATIHTDGYAVTAIPVKHSIAAVGYQITSPEGKTLFYTGDTGANLEECWRHVSPQLLVIEVTMPDRWEEHARGVNHLTPALLKKEMESFRKLQGYLPKMVTVHMIPEHEDEIAGELASVSRALGQQITPAHEGMRLYL
ncbi:MBL fold metallo-hydrolase [Chloroflexota bacterium]